MAVVIRDRLKGVMGIAPSIGVHPAPPDGEPPRAFCVMEKWAYVTGQEWTGNPANCCPTVSAFLRRYNDTTDGSGREALDTWVSSTPTSSRPPLTMDVGRRARVSAAADWAVRTALPVSLRVAGMPGAADDLEASPEVVDAHSAHDSSELVNDVRKGLPRWWVCRSLLREKVQATSRFESREEAVIEEIVAGASLATFDASIGLATVDAAATAAALGDVGAATAADAVAGATADASAAAALDTAAHHAAALAREDPPADPLARWTGIYGAVNPPVAEWLACLYATHWQNAGGSFQSSSLGLLKRMVSIGQE